MNDHEAQRVAAAANQLRPDWPTSSLLTLIRKNLMDRPRRDVAVALAWVACEANTSNPGRVLESGPWWKAAGVDGDTTGRREPFDPTKFCGTCNRANDQRHPEDHAFETVVVAARSTVASDSASERIAYARAAIGDAKATRGVTPATKKELAPSSPDVDRLRAAMTEPTPNDTEETAR